jgi:hypothetical protein
MLTTLVEVLISSVVIVWLILLVGFVVASLIEWAREKED